LAELPKAKKGLHQFVEENDKLLSVFGIFGALTAFFAQLKYDAVTGTSFLAFFLLAMEVWFSFPKSEEASIRLQLFEFAFFAMFLSLGGYLITAYQNLLWQISSLILFVIFAGVYSLVVIGAFRRFGIPDKISAFESRSKRLNMLIRTVFAGMTILLMLVLAALSSQLIRSLLR
jgi:hypothetical protein